MRANIDYKPILSIIIVLKYIAKYVAKAETKFEPYHVMLSHISSNYEADRPTTVAFHKMLVDNLIDHDISA